MNDRTGFMKEKVLRLLTLIVGLLSEHHKLNFSEQFVESRSGFL